MEVLVGTTTAYAMEMEVSSASGGGGGSAAAFVNDREENTSSCLFLTGSEDSSEISSSIGDPEDSDVEDDGDSGDKDLEVSSSKLCLDSLEDSLPIKRGLSSHFAGKSKSFTNLADVSKSNTVKDLEKPENPFNKRRRVLIANKLARKSSFYSWQNPKSMPLLTVHEDQDETHQQTLESEENDEEDEEKKNKTRVCGNRLKKKIGFKSHSCFSLADLHEEDEDDEYR